jgi:hypothetical protein
VQITVYATINPGRIFFEGLGGFGRRILNDGIWEIMHNPAIGTLELGGLVNLNIAADQDDGL